MKKVVEYLEKFMKQQNRRMDVLDSEQRIIGLIHLKIGLPGNCIPRYSLRSVLGIPTLC